MISMIESKEDQKKMLQLCEKTAFGCKIAGIVSAYGFDKKFACFWMDSQEQTVYTMLDDVMLISGTITKPEETAVFIRAVGVEKLFCAVRNAEALEMQISEKGDVLKRTPPKSEITLRKQEEVPIRNIYALLKEAGMDAEFEAFYLDLSHRLRHNAAMVAMEYDAGALVGCAIVSSFTETSAILSAVAVAENARRKGIGTKLIKEMERQLGEKTIYVYKEANENEAFYKSLGYQKTDTWVSGVI